MYSFGVFIGSVFPFAIGFISIFFILKLLKIKNPLLLTTALIAIIAIFMIWGHNWATSYR